jgi:hypothetical protein
MFFNPVSILCFDGEVIPAVPAVPAAPAGTPPAGTLPVGDPTANIAGTGNPGTGNGDGDRTFSQADLNKILADDKRKHQERYAQLETEHHTLLQSQTLTEEERNKLNDRLADLQGAQRTKEQQIEFDRKKTEEKHNTSLKEAQDRGDHWEELYKKETVVRAILDAASSGDAYNPAQVVDFLEPKTELKDIEGRLTPMVDFPDIDEKTGKPVQTLCSPADAVKRMRQLTKKHGNLFKSNVVSGVGAGQGEVSPSDTDYQSMDPATYRKNRDAIIKQVSGR